MPDSGLRSYALFPILVVAIGSIATFGSGFDAAAWLGMAPEANPMLVTLAAVVIFYPTVAALERLFPYRRDWNRGHGGARTDTLYLLIRSPLAAGLADATVRGTCAGAALWLTRNLGMTLWPTTWSIVAQCALAVLIAEFGHYWFHRLTHEKALLWRLHATHHSAPRLYWLNATRFHPCSAGHRHSVRASAERCVRALAVRARYRSGCSGASAGSQTTARRPVKSKPVRGTGRPLRHRRFDLLVVRGFARVAAWCSSAKLSPSASTNSCTSGRASQSELMPQ